MIRHKEYQKLRKTFVLIICFYFEIFLGRLLLLIIAKPKSGLLSSSFGFSSLEIVSIVVILSLLVLIPVISLKRYRAIIFNLNDIPKRYDNLKLEDVFENEKRKRILQIVLNTPGIHYNKLMKDAGLSPGQFQWHIKVLKKFNLIECKRDGQYRLFYPIIIPGTKLEKEILIDKPSKAKIHHPTTLSVYETIKKQPGIFASKISRKLELGRSTVTYHINKLAQNALIYSTKSKKGRNKLLYPV